ncbi:unnamed protein product [Effrenium voratum]|nr:unnamed protein product [Effrenium voratum]
MERAQEDPWSDRVGVREVVHRVPGKNPDPLATYQQYVGLEEWESMKSNLSKEVIPMRRYYMSDYCPEEVLQSVEVPLQLPEGEVEPVQPICARQRRRSSPKADAVQLWLAAKERALQSPRKRIALPQHVPKSRPTRAAGQLICSPRSEEAIEPALTVQVSDVDPRHLTARRREASGRGPVIKDKERSQYPPGKSMRPLRKANEESLQKLTEALGDPSRVNAKQSHPSRCFTIVPKTNLRVV